MMGYVNAAHLNERGADDSASINHGVVWFICGREHRRLVSAKDFDVFLPFTDMWKWRETMVEVGNYTTFTKTKTHHVRWYSTFPLCFNLLMQLARTMYQKINLKINSWNISAASESFALLGNNKRRKPGNFLTPVSIQKHTILTKADVWTWGNVCWQWLHRMNQQFMLQFFFTRWLTTSIS